jgi:caffeoyl-CoA O-methyltransferase
MQLMTSTLSHLLPHVQMYLDRYPVEETELQRQMRAQAASDGREHWIIPAEVGRLFYLLARATKARQIYEIGSYVGYSATWFANALEDGGRVIATERDAERYAQAAEFIGASALKEKIVLRHCDAVSDLEQSDETFDMVLIDHDKPDYPRAYHAAKKRTKRGGVIIADNILWRQRPTDSEWANDPSTRGVVTFANAVMNDEDVVSLIVPIGDGVSLSLLK